MEGARMSAAKQILSNMIVDLPEDIVPEIITYVAFIQRFKKNSVFKDLEQASASSMDFWDNPIDDEVWNNA
jgi:hypothetical protein